MAQLDKVVCIADDDKDVRTLFGHGGGCVCQKITLKKFVHNLWMVLLDNVKK